MNPYVGKAIDFAKSPLGEEVLEGVGGAAFISLPELFSEQPLDQTALQFALGAAGGVGLGMAGRRLGAFAGKAINPNALKDQKGLLASFGRLTGNDTTIQGANEQSRTMKSAITESLINESSSKMARDAIVNPEGFSDKYGITPEVFKAQVDKVQGGRALAQVLENIDNVSPEQRQVLADKLLGEYELVEKAIAQNAVDSVDSGIKKASELLENPETKAKLKEKLGNSADDIQQTLKELATNAPTKPITGEHIGKAIGRFAGDEIGILTGIGVANLLYNGSEEQV